MSRRYLPFPAVAQYPTVEASLGARVGPYDSDATADAPLADEQ
jgi:hypothetical protein